MSEVLMRASTAFSLNAQPSGQPAQFEKGDIFKATPETAAALEAEHKARRL